MHGKPRRHKQTDKKYGQSCSKVGFRCHTYVSDLRGCVYRKFIEMEMKSVMETKVFRTRSDKEYIVHYLRSSMMLESVPLQKATKVCTICPILVISYSGNVVKARCCVPKVRILF